MAAGRFDYDQRGLLDRGHVRFFTRRSFERMLDDCGLEVVDATVVGSPIADVLERGGESSTGRLVRAAAAVDRAAAHVWPTMFGYQFLYVLAPEVPRRPAHDRVAIRRAALPLSDGLSDGARQLTDDLRRGDLDADQRR